jgi:hypothetical protein
MEDEQWRIQWSDKLGSAMLNLRGQTVADILKMQEEVTQAWDAFKAFSALFGEAGRNGLPISHPAAVPPPGALQTNHASVVGLQPGEVATHIKGVIPKVNKDGKPYSQILFGDGNTINVFDAGHATLARTAFSEGRLVAILFVQKGQFKNLGSIRLLGAA